VTHLCEPLGGTEGLVETVGFKKTTMYVMKNKREYQQGVSSILRGSSAGTAGSKVCVDMRN